MEINQRKKGTDQITVLTHDKKHRLSYSYYIENIPVIELCIRYDLTIDIIHKFLTDVINNEEMMKRYLPAEYWKSLKDHNFLGKFSGYYDYIKEEMYIGSTPEYNIDQHLIFAEGQSLPYIVTERRSFTEILNHTLLMVKELNN